MQQEPKQVFISYSAHDAARAIAVRDFLESNGITCWFAKRDILGGMDYVPQITKAIGECDVLVMLLSKRAQKSRYIRSELEWAVGDKKIIIPFMLEDFELIPDFAFHLPNNQRIDAYINRAEANNILLASVRNILEEHGKSVEQQHVRGQAESLQKMNIQPKLQNEYRDDANEPNAEVNKSERNSIVRVNDRSDKIRCPRCRSSVFVNPNDDVRELKLAFWIFLVIAIVFLAFCAMLLECAIKGILIDRSLVTSTEYIEWIESIKKTVPFEGLIDYEGDVFIRIGILAGISLIVSSVLLALAMSMWEKLAKSYRERLIHGQSGMEAIPYSCQKCNEQFTVIVPLTEKWWN